jgi:nicotinamidase-related amidase
MLNYVQSLAKNGRYPLCIWPPHTLIGSTGHAVIPILFEALKRWEEKNFAMVDYVTKGSNIYTEHYGVFLADVPQSDDPGTQINTKLINTLKEVDELLIAGEAGSHCVKFSVSDLAQLVGDDSYVKKIVFLTDAVSPVPGFEKQQEDFIAEMTKRGMQLSTTKDFLA